MALHEFENILGIKDSEEIKTVTTAQQTLKTMAGATFSGNLGLRSLALMKSFGYL